jgi:predicted ribosome quality control (RQC) complex YloA/Tae2 family protein
MYKNYFLFGKQLDEIKPDLLGSQVKNIFTFRKNEVILELNGNQPVYLHINISRNLPYFFIQPVYNIRDPKYNLFEQLHDQTILDMAIKPYDKYITIEFELYKLKCIFYGRQPNIYLTDQNDFVLNSFKNGHVPEQTSSQNKADFRNADIEFTDFSNKESLESYLKNKLAAMSNTLIKEIEFRFYKKIKTENSTKLIDRKMFLKQVIQDMREIYNTPGAIIYYQNNQIKNISLIRLYHLEYQEKYNYVHFASVNEAWKRFVSEKTDQIEYDKLYKRCTSAINKKKSYLERALNQIDRLKDIEERKKLAELKGNLLLIFINEIDADKNEVILKNIFSDNLEKIKIKLNPNKSVSENAQTYFNKYKDIGKKRLVQRVRRKTLAVELEDITILEDKINDAKNLTAVKKIYKNLIERNLIRDDSVSSQPIMPFKHLIIGDNWQVFIGKSGENNDKLTFSFAKKNDYWFHAQGVPGSHVILRNFKGNQTPPHTIIERTAAIAAANSKAQHSSVAPVIYTLVRYVSRVRNAPKGTVKVQNEKTVFVEPLDIG